MNNSGGSSNTVNYYNVNFWKDILQAVNFKES